MKECRKCERVREDSEFSADKKAKDGLFSYCKECAKSYKLEWAKNNKDKRKTHVESNKQKIREKIYAYLLEHPCVDCGESDPIVLDFDHRGDKSFGIGKAAVQQRMAWERVLTEIAKCDVRCKNCHARKTARDFGWYKHKMSQVPVG